MSEYNKEGNLILHGPSFYEKIEKQRSLQHKSTCLSEKQQHDLKIENNEYGTNKPTENKDIQFRKDLITARSRLKLTQVDLANKCCVKLDVIKNIEAGKTKVDNHLCQKLKKILQF
tara:strand:- start:1019 stop:1366 length:348 start_codon:yes stop_codon:yes gene_type:complete